jgi:UDP-GlcNAc:undecaprenyl-phosphate GlcNAc-1-phosphate transferase
MLVASLSVTAAMTPPISRLARNRKIVDRPGLHKTHHESKPLLGGLAIFLGITVTMLFFTTMSTKLLSLFAGALVLVITGLFDDIYNIRPLVKLAGQGLAASIVVLFNLSYFTLFFKALEPYYFPSWFIVILLIGWIMLMINAVNLIDGLDGLAAGSGAIIFASMAIINVLTIGSANMLVLQIAGLGACIGFLIYNFNPAKIFMGDTGSMLIGFLLASTYLISLNGAFSPSLVLGSIFIFGYPALDTLFAIYRRIRRRSSIFEADKSHIHHIFINLGLSVRKTVILIYVINIFFGALAVMILCMNLSSLTIIVLGSLTAIITFLILRTLTRLSVEYEIKLVKKCS